MFARVLVVDDEPYIVKCISDLLCSQDDLDIICHTAGNADEALSRLAETKIDLLITDIEMPGMSGIELIRTVRVRWPDCCSLVLTAHPQFAYAYEAYHLGIVSYVLKTESDQRILEEIRKALSQVEKSELSPPSAEHSPEGDCFPDKDSVYRTLYLSLIADGAMSRPERRRVMEVFGIREQEAPLVYIAARCGGADIPSERAQLTLRHMMRRAFDAEQRRTLFGADGDLCCWLIQLEQASGANRRQIGGRVEGLLENVQNWCYASGGVSASFLFCEPVQDAGRLPVMHARAARMFASERSVSERFIYCLGEDDASLSEADLLDMRNDDATILSIKQYLEAHVLENVSLGQLAGFTNFSASYLSRYFKKKSGENLNKYIAQLRLEKIKRLIEDGELTLNEIAERAGFESRSYFNRYIKRMTGLSPQQWQRNVRERRK